MLALCIYFSSLVLICSSSPIPSENGANTVGWVPDPNGRGTTGLIISCLLTLGLCVWNAMHLNIPPKGETRVEYWWRISAWVFLGVLIPELVVLSAWRQWLSARQMNKALSRILEERTDRKHGHRRFEWTLAHSYYASMGGFVFEQEFLPQGSKNLFDAPERLTLTASGVLLLAKCGHLPDLNRETIWDKSKADGLAKALVCLQAAWMVLQILGRLVAHESITLLEVNTLGHIFCALVIYILWWKKPKGVKVPTVLEGPWTGPLAGYMYMSSRISGRKTSGFIKLSQWVKPELSEFGWYPISETDHGSVPTETVRADRKSQKTIHCDFVKSHHGELRPRPVHALTGLPSTIVKPSISQDQSTQPTRSARLAASSMAINIYPALRELLQRPAEESSCLKPKLIHLVADVATNWPGDFYLPGISGELMGMALWLSSSLYGGIHVAAWSEFFPTTTERLLWRFSAAYIAGSGAFWFLLCVIAFRWPWASQHWDKFKELRAWKVEYAVVGFGATVCGLAYVFARVFLVIDAVVSLRRLPGDAYNTPQWSTIFPHL